MKFLVGPWVNRATRVFAAMAIVFYACVLGLVTFAPNLLEQSARAFATSRLHKEIETLASDQRLDRAREITDRQAAELMEAAVVAKAQLHEQFDRAMIEIVSVLCRFDCSKRQMWLDFLERSIEKRWAEAAQAIKNLKAIAQSRFSEIVLKLRSELVFFTVSNITILAMLFVATLFARGRYNVLGLPALLCVVGTTISAGLYLFGQNWFYAILFDNYMRAGYLVLDFSVCLLLIDWFVLKGRITAQLLSGFPAGIPVPVC
jgi:hypothetical protein